MIRGGSRFLHALVQKNSTFNCQTPSGSALLQRLFVANQRSFKSGFDAVRHTKSSEYKLPKENHDTKTTCTFAKLGLSSTLIEGLRTLGIEKPTSIQEITIPALRHPANYAVASHTGSGKTLAYLLPLAEHLRAEEAAGFVPRPRRPRALVLAPTKELTEQIAASAKLIAHFAKWRCAPLNGNKTIHSQKTGALMGPLDVAVATPTRLMQLLKRDGMKLDDVRWLVIDEADTMLTQGWQDEVEQLLAMLKKRRDPRVHALLVSASLTREIRGIARALLPDLRILETATLHRAAPGSRHVFTPLGRAGDKMHVLEEVLAPDVSRGHRVLVFCNTLPCAQAVQHFLDENGTVTVACNGTMPLDERRHAIKVFTGEAYMEELILKHRKEERGRKEKLLEEAGVTLVRTKGEAGEGGSDIDDDEEDLTSTSLAAKASVHVPPKARKFRSPAEIISAAASAAATGDASSRTSSHFDSDEDYVSRRQLREIFQARVDREFRPPVMVATDVAARGLDFSCRIDHVVNFDFPLNSIDYLHRTGRTARAGKEGKVTSIVGKLDRILADRIQFALKHDDPLDALSIDPYQLQKRKAAAAAAAAAPATSPVGGKNTTVSASGEVKADGAAAVPSTVVAAAAAAVASGGKKLVVAVAGKGLSKVTLDTTTGISSSVINGGNTPGLGGGRPDGRDRDNAVKLLQDKAVKGSSSSIKSGWSRPASSPSSAAPTPYSRRAREDEASASSTARTTPRPYSRQPKPRDP